MFIFNLLVAIFAVALILFGLAMMIAPTPFGFVFVILGLVILTVVAPFARPVLRGLRRIWPWFDRQLDRAQNALPEAISRPLRESDPPAKDSDETQNGA
ncbi:MAG: hypothetical protein ACE5FO_10635 [Parvularculaceae bacterium]